MILDAYLNFTGQVPATGIYNANGTDSPTTGTQDSGNIIDLGVTSGVPSSANGGGARDIGIGDDPALELSILVTTAFAGGTSLAIALQGAPDNGSGAPGTWTTMWSLPATVLATLVAGQQLANVTVPRTVPNQPVPRFLKMVYTSVGTFTGGGAIRAGVVLDRDDQILGTGGVYSGYPAGLNVAN